MKRSTLVGILYNAFDRRRVRPRETLSERAVEQAAREAGAALNAAGYRILWLPVRSRVDAFLETLRRRRPAAIVNLCEGFSGGAAGEVSVAGLLELLGIPFTGSGPCALAQCLDKFSAKCLLRGCGLPTPRGWLAAEAGDVPEGAGFPLIVKPVAEDAGIGIYPESVVRTRADLARRIGQVVRDYGRRALVEAFVEGREINVAVAELPEPRVLPFSEIVFDRYPPGLPRLVGYDAKWRGRHPAARGTRPVCPAPLAPALARRLSECALRAWRILDLRGCVRLDFRVDLRGRPFLLEVNPNPDTSRSAGLMRALAAAGVSPEAFWRIQVETARRRWKEAA